MKTKRMKTKPRSIRLPRKSVSYAELSDFFDRHDAVDLLDRGIMEIDPDRADLERMLLGDREHAPGKRAALKRLAAPSSTT